MLVGSPPSSWCRSSTASTTRSPRPFFVPRRREVHDVTASNAARRKPVVHQGRVAAHDLGVQDPRQQPSQSPITSRPWRWTHRRRGRLSRSMDPIAPMAPLPFRRSRSDVRADRASADACSSSRASAWGSLSDTLAHKSGSGRPRFRPGDVRPSSDAGGLSRSVLARRRAPRRRARSGSARASDPRPSSRPYGASLAG
jgi:hypothetical protein